MRDFRQTVFLILLFSVRSCRSKNRLLSPLFRNGRIEIGNSPQSLLHRRRDLDSSSVHSRLREGLGGEQKSASEVKKSWAEASDAETFFFGEENGRREESVVARGKGKTKPSVKEESRGVDRWGDRLVTRWMERGNFFFTRSRKARLYDSRANEMYLRSDPYIVRLCFPVEPPAS